MIFFVHVAKTAGSTMNRYLAENHPSGVDHCERYLGDRAALADVVRKSDWMSGHVTLPAAIDALAPLRSDIRYFTCIRRPAAQVRSHYNWLVEIHRKGAQFYEAHPRIIKDISEQVRRTVANPTPAGVARDLRAFAGLFLNSQSRYFFGAEMPPPLQRAEDAEAFAALPVVASTVAAFDAIAESGSIEALFNHIHGSPRYSAANRQRVNVSRYHFDPGLFESEEVTETLRLHNRIDNLLYDHLAARMVGNLLVNRARPVAVADGRA
jgi:hypothetical protein